MRVAAVVEIAPAIHHYTVVEWGGYGAGATEAAETLPGQWRRSEALKDPVHLLVMRHSGVFFIGSEFPKCSRVLRRNKTDSPFPNVSDNNPND